MGRIWTVGIHTVREAIRMKVVVAFAVLVATMIFILPPATQRTGATVSSNVQTFLSWSLMVVSFFLSFLAIFLGSLSISDEMYHRQIYTLVTKPIPRWQYVLGKWFGTVLVLTGLLVFSGVCIYGMTRFLASRPNHDPIDQDRLKYEVLTARATSPLFVPDYTADAEMVLQRKIEDGSVRDTSPQSLAMAKAQILQSMVLLYRSIVPGETAEYEFRNILISDRSPEKMMQLRYKAKGHGYNSDEILQTAWWFGNAEDAQQTPPIMRRDVMDRYHIISFPASTISPNGTLKIYVRNIDDRPETGQRGATISFEAQEGFEVLYSIGVKLFGEFEDNLIRTLFLIWCRVILIGAVAVFSATFVSFPVACLITFMFYVLAIGGDFVTEALGFGVKGKGALGPAQYVIEPVLQFLFTLWPKFKEYNGIPTMVDGRIVSLTWCLMALGKLVFLLTTTFLMLGCIIFRRRQVAELSI